MEHWDEEAINPLLNESNLFAPAWADQGGTIVVSAKSYARIFRVLYNATYLNREMSEVALGSSPDLHLTRVSRVGFHRELS